jgi:YggT family protein
MLIEAAQFLLDMLLQPFAAILLLRFHLQWLRAPLRNPLGEFIMLITNPLVLRTRRFVPALLGLDTASLLLAALVESGYLWLTLAMHNYNVGALTLLAWTVLKLCKLSLYLLMGALFVSALLSWTNPHTPFAPVLHSVTEPFLRPLRRWIPTAGNFDFSVLALFLILQLILMLPFAWIVRESGASFVI